MILPSLLRMTSLIHEVAELVPANFGVARPCGRRHGFVDSRQKTNPLDRLSRCPYFECNGVVFHFNGSRTRRSQRLSSRASSSRKSRRRVELSPDLKVASEARLLRPGRFCGGSAFGSLFRISTCKDKELTILK